MPDDSGDSSDHDMEGERDGSTAQGFAGLPTGFITPEPVRRRDTPSQGRRRRLAGLTQHGIFWTGVPQTGVGLISLTAPSDLPASQPEAHLINKPVGLSGPLLHRPVPTPCRRG